MCFADTMLFLVRLTIDFRRIGQGEKKNSKINTRKHALSLVDDGQRLYRCFWNIYIKSVIIIKLYFTVLCACDIYTIYTHIYIYYYVGFRHIIRVVIRDNNMCSAL
jgi:hypothetical protein